MAKSEDEIRLEYWDLVGQLNAYLEESGRTQEDLLEELENDLD